VDRTGQDRLAPGQKYRRCVAVPPNAFASMFLLSQWRYVDADCCGEDMLLIQRLPHFERMTGYTVSLRSFE
jgi:hypothetical protein